MLSVQNTASVLDALVTSGNSEIAQQFFGCCGPNWKGALESLPKGTQKILKESEHQTKVNPRVLTRVVNTLVGCDREDLVFMLCTSRIGNIGRIAQWCTPHARRVISCARGQYL